MRTHKCDCGAEVVVAVNGHGVQIVLDPGPPVWLVSRQGTQHLAERAPASFAMVEHRCGKRALIPDDVMMIVADYYQCRVADITGTRRFPAQVRARHVACYFLRNALCMSYSEIGRVIQRDHSTVMSAVQRVHECVRDQVDRAAQAVAHDVRQLRPLIGGIQSDDDEPA